MATTISDFKIRIDIEGQAEITNLKKSLDDTQKSFDNVGNSATKASQQANKYGQVVGSLKGTLQGVITTGNGFTDSLLGSFRALGGVASGAALAVTALVGLGARAVSVADQISDVSKATDISASRLLNFKASVIEAGGNADDFSTIAFKLNQSLADAAAGNETVRRNFQRLGVAIYDAGGNMRETDAIFADIIENFNNGTIGSEEMAAAIDILGKNISKLDVKGLSAVNDQFKDEQIAQLEKYKGAIEKLGNQIDESLIKLFGGAALGIQNYLTSLDELEAKANATGQTYRNRTEGFIYQGFGPPATPLSGEFNPLRQLLGPRDMTAAEMEKFLYPQGRGPVTRGRARTPATALAQQGLPALTSEQTQSVELARNQTEFIRASAAAQLKLLQGVNATIGASKIEAEIAKAKLEIDTQTEQKVLALAKQRKDLLDTNSEDKRVTDAKVAAIDAEIKSERQLGEQRKKNREDEIRNVEKIRQIQKDIVLANEKLSSEINIQLIQDELALIGLYGDELKLKTGILRIENERLKAIQNVVLELDKLGIDATEADRQAAADRIIIANNEAAAKTDALTKGIERDKQIQQDYKEAIKQQVLDLADSLTPAQTAVNAFQSVVQNVDQALSSFIQRGKLNFKDFTESLLRDLALVIARMLVFQTIMAIIAPFSPTAAAALSKLTGVPMGKAKGGPVTAGQPYITGELGPELFIPRTSGTIIPNNQLGMGGGGTTEVTYNINAVDAASFRSLVARDPQFLYSVTEVGRRSNPARRLA